MPKSRLEFWRPKLERNVKRDLEVREQLEDSGWKHLTIWECELRHLDALRQKVKEFLQ